MYKIDCYGNKSNSCDYMHREKKPYEVDEATTAGVTYIRFSPAEMGVIHRITEADGVTTIAWNYGAWANRATLEYPNSLSAAIDEPTE